MRILIAVHGNEPAGWAQDAAAVLARSAGNAVSGAGGGAPRRQGDGRAGGRPGPRRGPRGAKLVTTRVRRDTAAMTIVATTR